MNDENGQTVGVDVSADVPEDTLPGAQLGVGETAGEQAAPVSTVARERMIEIIANNKKVLADCEQVMIILNERPDLDASFCRLFGITRTPGKVDVSR